jgi:hypothetical protein
MRRSSHRSVALVVSVVLGVGALTAGFKLRSAERSRAGSSFGEGNAITYQIAWSWDGARWDEEHRSYVFSTDRGYAIRLTAAYLGTASLELVPCKTDPASSPMKAAAEFFLPASAWANHGYIHDASLLEAPVVESAFSSEVRPFGTARSSGKTYCQLHELLVPLDQAAGDGFHLDRWSAFVRGSFTMPGSTEERAFESHANLRGGALVDLSTSTVSSSGQGSVVRVTRSALHAFDGVAIEKLTSSELAYAFMRGLTKGTRAEIALPR